MVNHRNDASWTVKESRRFFEPRPRQLALCSSKISSRRSFEEDRSKQIIGTRTRSIEGIFIVRKG